MLKILRKTKPRDPVIAARVKRTSELIGVSPRQVYRVIQGEQQNEKIMDTYMFLMEGEENLLIEAVKKAVPFRN